MFSFVCGSIFSVKYMACHPSTAPAVHALYKSLSSLQFHSTIPTIPRPLVTSDWCFGVTHSHSHLPYYQRKRQEPSLDPRQLLITPCNTFLPLKSTMALALSSVLSFDPRFTIGKHPLDCSRSSSRMRTEIETPHGAVQRSASIQRDALASLSMSPDLTANACNEPTWPSGWRPWLALFGGFLLMFNSWGWVNVRYCWQLEVL